MGLLLDFTIKNIIQKGLFFKVYKIFLKRIIFRIIFKAVFLSFYSKNAEKNDFIRLKS